MGPAQDTPVAELPDTLARLRAAWQAGKPGLAQRRDDLLRLRAALKRRLMLFKAVNEMQDVHS